MRLLFLILILIPSVAQAQEFRFPVACTLNQSCWITSHMDMNDRVGVVQDYRCGSVSSDQSNGMFIALQNTSALARNFPIVAAENGIVAGTVDGIKDVAFESTQIAAQHFNQNFCGNGVRIKHAQGFETRYCHMRERSVLVKPGQFVQKGQIIGTVGQSGLTDWPGLYFALFQNEEAIDPYTGWGTLEGCQTSFDQTQSLWEAKSLPPYQSKAIISHGFSITSPEQRQISIGAESLKLLPTNTPLLTYWSHLFNIQKGDIITLKINAPDGHILAEYKATIEGNLPRLLLSTTARRGDMVWNSGDYKATTTINNGTTKTEKKISIILR